MGEWGAVLRFEPGCGEWGAVLRFEPGCGRVGSCVEVSARLWESGELC